MQLHERLRLKRWDRAQCLIFVKLSVTQTTDERNLPVITRVHFLSLNVIPHGKLQQFGQGQLSLILHIAMKNEALRIGLEFLFLDQMGRLSLIPFLVVCFATRVHFQIIFTAASEKERLLKVMDSNLASRANPKHFKSLLI